MTSASRTRGLDRAVEIIDYLTHVGKAVRPTDIAKGIGAPKSSVYQLINVLVQLGVLEWNSGESFVFLGKRVSYWGTAYLNNFDLTRSAEAHLEELADKTGETTQLSMLDGDKYIVMLMHEGKRPFRISADVGRHVPIPWTASGRLLMGGMTEKEIRAFIPVDDFILPNGKRLDPTEFSQEANKAYREGFYSFDSITDNYTHCFAAPVCDTAGETVACVCIVAPKDDAKLHYDAYRLGLEEAAKNIESGIGRGYKGPNKMATASLRAASNPIEM